MLLGPAVLIRCHFVSQQERTITAEQYALPKETGAPLIH